MKDNVRIDFVIVLLLDIFGVAHMQICKGSNGTSCCFGYTWDQNQSMCIPCKKGYYGKNCDAKCPSLFFGLGCQSQCNCSKKECDYINGCRQLTEEQQYTFTIGSDYNVKTSELNDNGNSFDEESIDTLVQDGTIIMQMQYQSNSLMYALIGLSVAAVLIVIAYVLVYTCQLLTS